ncbi:transmembrane protein, putative [Medicago truncatula]|uniref:Transmembrane protein, putative n=1 Tax=Medicago truncatula TaxID=3880 RepID=A0A072U5D0_MEDTR|nr:transmembrane protein, putative [Medicago truncatula]
MTSAASMLQIWRHGYSEDLNIVICVGICTLPFYAINMDVLTAELWNRLQLTPEENFGSKPPRKNENFSS